MPQITVHTEFEINDTVLIKFDDTKTKWQVAGFQLYRFNMLYLLESGQLDPILRTADMLELVKSEKVGFKATKE